MSAAEVEVAPAAPAEKLPVTILSGFLGAGKTTLLSHLINNRAGLRIGLIINDMSEVNIDAELIRSGDAALSRVEDKLVELSNGCICCTLREDLLSTMIALAGEGRFDYLLVESTGISEPLQVAEVFTFADAEGRQLSDYCRLDTCVTVVDAFNFSRDYNSRASLSDRGMAAHTGDERHVVDLLIDQVEFANVIVVNKTDLMMGPEGAADKARLMGSLRALNPSATIIESVRGNVPPAAILNTRLFSLEAAAAAPGWLQELRGSHVPETAEYGITSFVFRAKVPFHPARLHELVYASPALHPVLRSKGFFWLAVDGGMDEVGIWAQAGRLFSFSAGRPWWATVPRKEWPPVVRAQLAPALAEGAAASAASSAAPPPDSAVWDPVYGDRRQEIVLIGCGMDRAAVEAALRACLVTPEEYGAGAEEWDGWDDPFDFYEYEDESEDGKEEGEGQGACGEGCGHDHGHGHPSSGAAAAGHESSAHRHGSGEACSGHGHEHADHASCSHSAGSGHSHGDSHAGHTHSDSCSHGPHNKAAAAAAAPSQRHLVRKAHEGRREEAAHWSHPLPEAGSADGVPTSPPSM